MLKHWEIVTPPTGSVLDLTAVKNYLRLDTSLDDPIIQGFMEAATNVAEAHSKRVLRPTRYLLRQSYFEYAAIPLYLLHSPVTSVDSVLWMNTNRLLVTMPTTDYKVILGTAAKIYPTPGMWWPIVQWNDPEGVQVTYTVGYALDSNGKSTVPAAIQTGMLLLVAHWYEHRTAASEIQLYDVPLTIQDLFQSCHSGQYI